MKNTKCSKMKIIFGDVTLGLKGQNFHYIFSYQQGGPESFVRDGVEWLYRTPRPTFWRATTDNDKGCGFHLESGVWMAADMFIACSQIDIFIDEKKIDMPVAPINNQYSAEESAEKVKIVFRYEANVCGKVLVDTTYEINEKGSICVSVVYHGRKGLPSLPVFGLRFIMPTKADGFKYSGLSGETYPDRSLGAVKGVYDIEGLPVTPYLIPQDCGVHMETEWLEIVRSSVLDNRKTCAKTGKMRIVCQDKPFAFSCIPYTAEELENATHQEELPIARRTVLCIYGAVRGVGGIDSWGSSVQPEYWIDGENDIAFSFRLFEQGEQM